MVYELIWCAISKLFSFHTYQYRKFDATFVLTWKFPIVSL